MKFSFCPKSARNYWASAPPGHPIIHLNSNEFNMAAVSVKRSVREGSASEWRKARTCTLARQTASYAGFTLYLYSQSSFHFHNFHCVWVTLLWIMSLSTDVLSFIEWQKKRCKNIHWACPYKSFIITKNKTSVSICIALPPFCRWRNFLAHFLFLSSSTYSRTTAK